MDCVTEERIKKIGEKEIPECVSVIQDGSRTVWFYAGKCT